VLSVSLFALALNLALNLALISPHLIQAGLETQPAKQIAPSGFKKGVGGRF
jgi:hypothetical protein